MAAQWLHMHCTVTARSRHGHGTDMAQLRHSHGTVTAKSWESLYSHCTVTAQADPSAQFHPTHERRTCNLQLNPTKIRAIITKYQNVAKLQPKRVNPGDATMPKLYICHQASMRV